MSASALVEILENDLFVFWAAATLICVVPSLGYIWSRVRKAELDAALKQTMLERGMSADEIERVLRAGRPGPGGRSDA